LNGGRAVFLRGGHIMLTEGGNETTLLSMAKIKPATSSQPEAVLAATAAAWALGVPHDLICAGLRSFENK
jgi:cyanophycin synthetase